jgi:hypothetical protein
LAGVRTPGHARVSRFEDPSKTDRTTITPRLIDQ